MAQTCCKTKIIREVAAVLLGILALVPLYFMVTSESDVNPIKYNPDTQFNIIRHGFQYYCYAFGTILMLAGAAFLLLGYNDKKETNPSALTPEDEEI